MIYTNDPIPGCVPELYRQQQEERDRRFDLAMRRREIYRANREKLDAADLECYDDAGVEGTLLGALDPEALIAEAEAWNGLIRKSFVARLEALFGAEGGMIDTAADFAMGTLETCALSAAAMMIDDEFAPAADYAVFYGRDDGFRPLLRKYMLDGIKAHPERYAIADITVKSY